MNEGFPLVATDYFVTCGKRGLEMLEHVCLNSRNCHFLDDHAGANHHRVYSASHLEYLWNLQALVRFQFHSQGYQRAFRVSPFRFLSAPDTHQWMQTVGRTRMAQEHFCAAASFYQRVNPKLGDRDVASLKDSDFVLSHLCDVLFKQFVSGLCSTEENVAAHHPQALSTTFPTSPPPPHQSNTVNCCFWKDLDDTAPLYPLQSTTMTQVNFSSDSWPPIWHPCGRGPSFFWIRSSCSKVLSVFFNFITVKPNLQSST